MYNFLWATLYYLQCFVADYNDICSVEGWRYRYWAMDCSDLEVAYSVARRSPLTQQPQAGRLHSTHYHTRDSIHQVI